MWARLRFRLRDLLRGSDDRAVDPLAVLQSVPFFARVPAERLQQLAGLSTWRRLSRGEFLFHSGEPADRLFVIASGRLAATVTSSEGAPLLFHVAQAGEAPGQVDVLGGGAYTASARALSAVTALCVPGRACVELLETEPGAMLAYARDLAGMVRALTDSMADLVFLDLERRLARTVADAPAHRDVVRLAMTQGELAARLGVARQSVNQALAKLARRGLIAAESAGTLRILDRAALDAFVKGGA